MIYYPLSVLMTAGIKDVLIIVNPYDLENYENLLGDGSQLGISISYKVQPSPDGLAQSFILGETFIGSSNVCLILETIYFLEKIFLNHLEKRNSKNKRSYHIFLSCK